MSKNIGTLITSPIRPNDSLDDIASAFANEIKGGHHVYATRAERDSIYESRRDWNMLCTVYNDGVFSKTYQLQYGHSSIDPTDNNNWVIFNALGTQSQILSEWVDSVFNILNTDPISATAGDRYLIASTGLSGNFVGQNDKVAIYDPTTSYPYWNFYVPVNGMSFRIDNQKNVLYNYIGTYSSGSWHREYLNQVRYIGPTSSDGLSYTYNNVVTTPLDSWSYSIYYANFSMTNSGTVSLVVDGLSQIPVRKLSGSTLLDLSAGDVVPGLEYQLIYNSGVLQTFIPSNTTVIGPAPGDGIYDGGLYTDFTSNTSIGVPIDRFNQVLKALVPPSAPNLESWSKSGLSPVTANLSFDNTLGVGFSFSSATQSTYLPTSKDGLFQISNPSVYRIGVVKKDNITDLTGVLNDIVPVGSGSPTPAYDAFSFGNANIGTVSMIFNGVTISSINLSYLGATDSTSGNVNSGLTLTAATNSSFPSGYIFNGFWNRTGTWRLKGSSFVDGYNSIVVRHDASVGQSYVLNAYEFVADSGYTTATTFSPETLSTTFNTGVNKFLSGIQFYTGYVVPYNVTVNNLYKNTYSNTGSVSFSETSGNFTTPTLISIPALGGGGNPNSTVVASTKNFTMAANKRSVPGDGISNGSSTFKSSATRTFSSSSSTGILVTNLFLDNLSSTSVINSEFFDDENFRLKNGSTRYSSSFATASFLLNTWDKTLSLRPLSGNIGVDNGLQVIYGKLIYPSNNFYSSYGTVVTNPNAANTSSDYSFCVSNTTTGFATSSGSLTADCRTYTRYFYVGNTVAYSGFTVSVSSTSTSAVGVGTQLSGNNIWVEVKLPYMGGSLGGVTLQPDGAVTGWLDAVTGIPSMSPLSLHADGVGCRDLSSSYPTLRVNLGTYYTTLSSGYILLRITAPRTWSGNLDQIIISV